MPREDATHTVAVRVTKEVLMSGRIPVKVFEEAVDILQDSTKYNLKQGPWFERWQHGDLIMKDGRILPGPAAIFSAVLEVKDVPPTTGDATEKSS